MMKAALAICTVVPLLFATAAAAQVPAVNWEKQKVEILRHYRALVQIDTSNPPGNETKAVEYLKKVFDAEGIPAKTFALDPARANLVARIKGNGSKRPILLMAHTDVVGVQREKWPVDPFGAVLKDGYVWGRGTADDKDKLVGEPDGDAAGSSARELSSIAILIFLAEPGEEGDTGPSESSSW